MAELSKKYIKDVQDAMKILEKEERRTLMSDKDIDRVLGAIRTVAEEYKRTWNLRPVEMTYPFIKDNPPVRVTEHGAEMSAKLPDLFEKKAKRLIDAAFDACREEIRYNPVWNTGGLYCVRLKLMDPRFHRIPEKK